MHNESILIGASAILILGILAQWVSWRFKIPAILLLILTGIFSGPVIGLIKPDEVFGDLLFPWVSLSVAIILFEGGLSLKFNELKTAGRSVFQLISIGLVITWVLAAFASRSILGFEWPMALLLGAILTVTGPTVILPLLRHLRPSHKVGSILKWESIIIDPVGAILAVLVFETAFGGAHGNTQVLALLGKTVLTGLCVGVISGGFLAIALSRYWIPDYLQNACALAVVMMSYVLSNEVMNESGLITVTIMGIVLTNQKNVSVRHIVEFKESLRVLLISCLFIVLAAKITYVSILPAISWRGFLFLAVVLAIRPVAVFCSSFATKLKVNEKIFLSLMAPRGIVAASVASIFAMRLEASQYPGSDRLVSFTFFIILGTVIIYGLGSPLAAYRLKVAQKNPQGLLFLGAQGWVRELALTIKSKGFRVLLVDSNGYNVRMARSRGLEALCGNILSEEMFDRLDLDGIGRFLALTSNEEINSLAAIHLNDHFGRSETYQMTVPQDKRNPERFTSGIRSRFLFDKKLSHSLLDDLLESGMNVIEHQVTREMTPVDFKSKYGEDAVVLFYGNAEQKTVRPVLAGQEAVLKEGDFAILIGKSDKKEEVKEAE